MTDGLAQLRAALGWIVAALLGISFLMQLSLSNQCFARLSAFLTILEGMK